MGRKNYLIDGVSGAGKTTVATELEKRNYHVVHGDRELVYRGNPETGEPVKPDTESPSAKWMSEHQVWDLEKVKAHIENREEEITFFCGGSRNSNKFIPLLDEVFILDVDYDEMLRRIDERVAIDPTDFGATQEERDLIIHLHKTKQDIPEDGIIVDANRPLEDVVGRILGIVSGEKLT